MTFKDKISDALSDGTVLALGAAALVVGVSEASKRGYIPKIGGRDIDPQFEDAPEFQGQFCGAEGGMNRGSAARGKGKGKSEYNKFVAKMMPHYKGKGYSSKDIMKLIAAQWRNR
jgi:hypothetical protein